ncbi:MAG TPA: hypothetical protein VGQ41_08215 [Pyrinomonadaceae bacterium]|nr:hypothetical protein [Pyrinomonadaceae bacterium]
MNINETNVLGQLSPLRSLTFATLLVLIFSVHASAQWTTSGSDIYNSNGGNVGIGTGSGPTRKLEVRGGNIFHQWSTSAGSEYGIFTALNNNHFTSNLYFDGQWKMIATGKGALISTGPNNGGNAFTVYADNTSRSANASASLTQILAVTMDGKVGVNTNNPTARFHVYEPAGSGVSARITIEDADNSAGINLLSWSRSWSIVSDNSPADGLLISSAGGANFFISNAGNVGIGTTTPTKALDVAGDVNASGTITGGNIKAKYQDVAEWVESSQTLPAGTVVILDSTKSNQVIASTHSYDSHVAGVISLQPGLALGEEGEGRVLVATTGRVKVKVHATNGPIQIGDLLVTSDKPGVAMKSLPVEIGGVQIHRPGTLIGKALEPLAQGTGEILVLLSLQ